MRALLIFNPAAGKGRSADALAALESSLSPFVAESVMTEQPGDAEAAARRACLAGGYDALLVAGGDGTINEAVNGLLAEAPNAASPIPLGILPVGTQNVLAQELGLVGGAEALARTLRAGRTRRIDLGRAGGRYFALMAGFGFDAAVVGELIHPVKEWIGPAAYAFATLGALAKYHSTGICLTLDGAEVSSEAYLVVVANAASYALQQVKLAPFASVDDGWLDICVFERAPTDKVGFVTQIMALLARRHLRDPRVRYYRARRIEIESTPPVMAQLDGDRFHDTPMTIDIVPQALSVFVPEDSRP